MATIHRLDTLEVEVLSEILEHVNDTSPWTIKAVSQVNRYLYAVTQNIAHHHKTIHFKVNNESSDVVALPSTVEKWVQDRDIHLNIRSLTVSGILPAVPYTDAELEWQPLVTLLTKIGKLRLLSWTVRGALPLTVLQALHDHQKAAKLQIFNFTRPSPGDLKIPYPIEQKLAKSPALTHLRMTTGAPDTLVTIAFRSIVSRAPLKYAGTVQRRNDFNEPVLAFAQDLDSDDENFDEDNEDDYDSNDDHDDEADNGIKYSEDYLNARRLFYHESQPRNTSLRSLTIDMTSLAMDSLLNWSKLVDLSKLESLKLSRDLLDLATLDDAATLLANLKHLSLNLNSYVQRPAAEQANVRNFLGSCPELETLSLWSWSGVITIDEIVERHGPTLKGLHLHEREGYDERSVLAPNAVQYIVQNCPHLQDMTIDLAFSGVAYKLEDDEDNLAHCKNLAKLGSQLNSLQIYFDSRIPNLADMLEAASKQKTADEGAANPVGDDSNDDNKMPTAAVSVAASNDQGPPRKRHRPLEDPEIENNILQQYAKDIWQVIFGSPDCAGRPRRLDVKFGEWERYNPASVVHMSLASVRARHMTVRPHERDDRSDQCVLKMHVRP